MKWTPDQVVATIIVVGCIALIALGIDGEVKTILGGAAAWIIRGQYQARKQGQGSE